MKIKSTTVAIVSLFLLMCCTSCKFSHQAQRSSIRSDSTTVHDSSGSSVSKTDTTETNEYTRETETYYAHGQQQDAEGKVMNYYYPEKIVYRETGRQQKNGISTDSTAGHKKDSSNHAMLATAGTSNTKGSLLGTWQIIGLCALACIILFAAGKIHSNYFHFKRNATTLAVPNVKGNAGMQPPG